MASGDVVNTAARLQSAAPTNGILVDETTFRATEPVISYREAPPVDAKGKTEPVVVFEALEAKARFGVDVRPLGSTGLVGRREELDTLISTLDRARREREPQLVTLVGVPGIGKSRLVWELFQHVDREPEPTNWRQGRSLPYGEGITFWALGEMVKAQAGILETDSSEQAQSKLRAAVDAVAQDEDRRSLERHLRPLVGLEGESGSEDRRTEAFAAWRRFLEALAEQHPLVLVFEDLHWADDALLDFVDHLVGWATGVPILVVGTARPELLERRVGWGGGKPNAVTLSLSPLSDDQTADLVHALLDRSVLDADTRTELLARAGGNPLYAEEFARLVGAGRALGDLPESIQGLIAARLDALTDSEKTLLQATAVAGNVFWLGAAAVVAGVPRWTAEELLHSLERKQFVRRERRSSVAGEDEYTFRHLLIRDVAYGQIPRAERGDKHRLVAEWIGSLGRPEDHAEMLAQHYLAALELANATDRPVEEIAERARDALIEAGDRATGLTASASAARFYEHALELLPDHDPRRPELLLRFGRALQFIADERAERVLEDASQALIDAGESVSAADAQAAVELDLVGSRQARQERRAPESSAGTGRRRAVGDASAGARALRVYKKDRGRVRGRHSGCDRGDRHRGATRSGRSTCVRPHEPRSCPVRAGRTETGWTTSTRASRSRYRRTLIVPRASIPTWASCTRWPVTSAATTRCPGGDTDRRTIRRRADAALSSAPPARVRLLLRRVGSRAGRREQRGRGVRGGLTP